MMNRSERSAPFDALWPKLAALGGVEAIALGGSRAGACHDEKSDIDLYVYCSAIPGEAARRAVLQGHCRHMEVGNRFWEQEDNCTLTDGVDIDIIYRRTEAFCAEVAQVVEGYAARNGYTTCLWHNLLHSRILHDPAQKLQAMRARFDVPYPPELAQNIIERNWRLLTGCLPSYDAQIKKALARGDAVSVNHRVAAYLESYFDIIFAMNGLTHPGEKRMVQHAKANAKRLPANFEANLNALLGALFVDAGKAARALDAMTAAMGALLGKA